MARWTLEQLQALRDAIASGVLTVEYADGSTSRKQTYQSLEQMRQVLSVMEADASLAPSYRLAVVRKGY